MQYIDMVFSIVGSLGLFLYGMKVMSDGIQQTAGERLQRVLAFMTGNRVAGVLTGFAVTAIIQSSSATTVMVVSFVNAGLLTLKQAIGVIMGANIGTTVTAWIVSLVGFSFKISAFALPAVGIGFIMTVIKWKHKDVGTVFLGFGLLFMGLDFLTKSMPEFSVEQLESISSISNYGFLSILLAVGIGTGITLLIHSSSASTAIIITMGFQGLISYDFAAGMILGANIGTTIDAALAAIGTKTAAQRAALVHVLFNVMGTVWALIFFHPLLALVNSITPGFPAGASLTTHLAMLHTVFNLLNTLVFLPFVDLFARVVSLIIKARNEPKDLYFAHYKLEYKSGSIQDTPELNILRAEKEIRDMAALTALMYSKIGNALQAFHVDAKETDKEEVVNSLVKDLVEQERYADEMREELTHFLIECTRQQLSQYSEKKVSVLLRITASLEEMTDDCYGASLLLERSVKKDLIFRHKETEALTEYSGMVESFLNLVEKHWGNYEGEAVRHESAELEAQINKMQGKLRKLGRKRIESGENIKTELLFIDLVRRIEKVGNYCYSISGALSIMNK
ncbi:MAG: Na/Pi cotransporter family protein [Treponema sp.]|jgi:phosphate:Na+ symporter|nr:Na/Pi cotransporter family protein [Treponema sp.]